jgi:hypothetical protein
MTATLELGREALQHMRGFVNRGLRVKSLLSPPSTTKRCKSWAPRYTVQA